MKIFYPILAVLSFSSLCLAASDLSRTAGLSLLNSFSCDGIGSKTQAVATSIGQLKQTVASIGEKVQECKGVAASISNLPDINAITSAFESDTKAQALVEQEKQLNEALADLSIVTSLPDGDPRRAQYPTPDDLHLIIVQNRSQLYSLKAQTQTEERISRKNKYVEGVKQLSLLGQRLTQSLDGNDGCFDKAPMLKQHLVSSLIGISGFFMNSPMGIGTTLAGKLLQNIFSISESGKVGDADKAFESADQAMLVAGMGCSLETMGKQHCKILKERKLFDKMTAAGSVCAECEDPLKGLNTLNAKQEATLQDGQNITAWLNRTDLSAAKGSASGQKEKLRSAFKGITSAVKQGIVDLNEKLKVIPENKKGEAQRAGLLKIFEKLGTIYGKKSDNDYGGCSGDECTTKQMVAQLQQFYSDKEKNSFLGQFVLGKSGEEADQVRAALFQEYEAAFSKTSSYEPATDDAAAFARLMKQPREKWGPKVIEIAKALESPQGLENLEARVKAFETQFMTTTDSGVGSEQLKNLTSAFYGNASNGDNPLKSVRRMNAMLKAVPKEFEEKYGNLTDIASLQKKTDAIIEMSEAMEKNHFSDEKEMKALIGNVNQLVGDNNQINVQMGTFFDRYREFELEKISNWSKEHKQPKVMSEALFAINKENLQDILNFSANETSKRSDYAHGQMLSATQLDSFTKYFEKYVKPAMNFLKGQNANSDPLSAGLTDNPVDEVKAHFCMRLLNLTMISDSVKKDCAQAEIRSGKSLLRFADFMSRPHPERTCAYPNFLDQERMSKAVR